MDRVVLLVDGSDPEAARAFLRHAQSLGFRSFASLPAHRALLPEPDRSPVLRPGRLETPSESGSGRTSIPIRTVSSATDVAWADQRLRAGEPVALRWIGDRIIPLENLIAHRARPGTLWVVTERLAEVPGFLGALESGADHVLYRARKPAELDELARRWDRTPPRFRLRWARITRREPAGVADRVLVDTTSLLAVDEGLLVGSAAGFLFLLRSEAVGSAHSRPRPFRVNSGAAHQYVLLANGETRYLSELEAGDALVASTSKGETRTVRVGRLKIERRPVVLVEAEVVGRRYRTFPQEAETVRLSGRRSGIPITGLSVGAQVLGLPSSPARHLGHAVDERILER